MHCGAKWGVVTVARGAEGQGPERLQGRALPSEAGRGGLRASASVIPLAFITSSILSPLRIGYVRGPVGLIPLRISRSRCRRRGSSQRN